jgi:hypothetical protein
MRDQRTLASRTRILALDRRNCAKSHPIQAFHQNLYRSSDPGSAADTVSVFVLGWGPPGLRD